MRRGTVVVIIFLLVAAGIIGASQFLRSQPPLELTVAVSPLAEDWAREAVEAFNQTDVLVNGTQRVHFNVQVVEDTQVWREEGRVNWTRDSHPDAWMPASGASLSYARDARFTFEAVADSIVQTPLVWGGFSSRADVLAAMPNGFDWDSVAEAAEAGTWAAVDGGESAWGNFKIGFLYPESSVAGLGVLFSGAAHFNGSNSLNSNAINSAEFRDWMEPIVRSVPNFNTLGGDPAAAMAGRGPSVAEIALLPEVLWLTNLDTLNRRETMRFAYPSALVVFDFPLAVWTDTTQTDAAARRQAVNALADHLLTPAMQTRALAAGLRPTPAQAGLIETAGDRFIAAESYGLLLNPPLMNNAVVAPSRSDAQRLVAWMRSVN